MRRASTLLIAEDALAVSFGFVTELRARYDLRVLQRPAAAFTRPRRIILREIGLLVRLLLTPDLYRPGNFMICGSGHYAALAVSRLLSAFGRKLEVFAFNFYLHRLGESAFVQRVLAFLLTEDVVVAVQSQVDLEYFRSRSHDVRLILVPYGQGSATGSVAGVSHTDVRVGDYVFAGGYTNRDYDRLLRCARILKDVRFVIACSILNQLTESVPDNVEVHRDLSPKSFHQLLAGARLVVIPLADDVGSAGQMVTLAAMQLGKAILVADSPVVTQYVEHGVTGLVYERTSDTSLRSNITTAIADEQRLRQLGAAAQSRYAQRFTRSLYDRNMLEALEDAFGDRAPPRDEARV